MSFFTKKNNDSTNNNVNSFSSKNAIDKDPYCLFQEYLDIIYNEIKDLPLPISKEMIKDETSIFLYFTADVLTKQGGINHSNLTSIIYSECIEKISSISTFQKYIRSETYLDVFLEPNKAKGIWLMSSEKSQNPLICCWYAFGDVLTNPNCVDDLETYFSYWSINLYGLPEQMLITGILTKTIQKYADYVMKLCKIIDPQ